MRWGALSLLSLLLSPLVSTGELEVNDEEPNHKSTVFNGQKVPPLTKLQGDEWSEQIDQGYWFVKAYSPYCPHCKRLAPKWQTAYEFYYTSKPVPASDEPADGEDSLNSFTRYYDFHFAELDCIAFSDACDDLKIQAYPTLMIFKDGEEVKRETGEREIPQLSKIIEPFLEAIKPGSRPVDGPALPEEGDKSAPGFTPNEEEKALSDAEENQLPMAGVTGDLIRKLTKPKDKPNPDGVSRNFDLETFQKDVTKTQNPWFIKFYAPWCPHCQRMGPSWESMAKSMQHRLNVGEVNCEVETRLCRDAGVTSYPTIYYFQGGERIEYTGLRGLGDFVDFANKAIEAGAGVKDVTLEQFESMERQGEEVIFLYAYDHATTREDFAALERLPLHLIGHAKLFKTRDVSLVKRFAVSTWPLLLVSRDGKATVYQHNTPADMRDVPKMTRWMRSVWLPLLPEITSANARSIMDGKIVVLGILSRDRSDEFAMAKREIKSAAIEWMEKESQDLQAATEDLRNAKQLRIDEAEDRDDQRAVKTAEETKIDVDRIRRREVTFAWIDGVFWERYVKTTFGISVKDGEKVVINDQKNHRYWDVTETGNPILPSRTSILETLPKTISAPPQLLPKHTGNALTQSLRRAGFLLAEHPWLSLLATLLVAAFAALSWRRFLTRRRRATRAGYLSPSEKEAMLGTGMPNGKVD